jgi:protoporphyrinogen oxidase
MVCDSNKTSLSLEYFCTEGDQFWNQNNEEAIELAGRELEKLKIAQRKDILDAFVVRLPHAYPIYDLQYRNKLEIIRGFLDNFSNLQCIGRCGMFRYNNMDHSILTGFLAAQNLFGAKENLWDINVDDSYNEELQDDSAADF